MAGFYILSGIGVGLLFHTLNKETAWLEDKPTSTGRRSEKFNLPGDLASIEREHLYKSVLKADSKTPTKFEKETYSKMVRAKTDAWNGSTHYQRNKGVTQMKLNNYIKRSGVGPHPAITFNLN